MFGKKKTAPSEQDQDQELEQAPGQDGTGGRGKGKKGKKPFDPYKDTYEWMHCIIVSVILCVLIFVLVARVIDVRGSSMLPNLEQGDKIIITRLAGDYEQGDIVVLKAENYKREPLVKRVIAVAGQTVDIDFTEGTVYVDGVALDEPYTFERTYESYDFDSYEKPVTVPEGCIFVMGDNRNNSSDSRVATIGFVDTRAVMGKAVFRLYPFYKVGALYGSGVQVPARTPAPDQTPIPTDSGTVDG